MRIRDALACSLMLIYSFVACGAPPATPGPIYCPVGKDKVIEVKFEKPFGWAPGFNMDNCTCVRLHQEADTDPATFLIRPQAEGEYHIIFWTIGEKGSSKLVVSTKDPNTPPNPPPQPPPVPVPPGPTPPPTPPTPPAPNADPALVDKMKTAIAEDGKTLADAKTHLKHMAIAYQLQSDRLAGTTPWPGKKPTNIGEAYFAIATDSIERKIPRLPLLQSTRTQIEAILGRPNGEDALTDAVAKDLAAKYAKIAAALGEASK